MLTQVLPSVLPEFCLLDIITLHLENFSEIRKIGFEQFNVTRVERDVDKPNIFGWPFCSNRLGIRARWIHFRKQLLGKAEIIFTMQKRESATDKVRIVAFDSDSILCQISVKEELISTEFPSTWLELKSKHTAPVAICGMYRE